MFAIKALAFAIAVWDKCPSPTESVDGPGNIFEDAKVGSPEECNDDCLIRKECVAWTFQWIE